jgi:glycine cleavage system aminomethyltransferase T
VSGLEFLSPAAAPANGHTPIARSPMEGKAQEAGARFEVRDGWNVAVDYAGGNGSIGEVAWADVSHLRKFELRGEGIAREFGTATRSGDGWWCPLTSERALVVGGSDVPDGALDVTTCYAALTILGPQARETIARFCALDLRPHKAPPQSFRPGSIARQPGMLIVEAENRFLLLFGWAVAEYMWTVVDDAARSLGGGPVGIETLARTSEVGANA